MDCTFAINDDDLVEGTENIYILATITTGVASFASGQNMAAINIVDNDGNHSHVKFSPHSDTMLLHSFTTTNEVI